VVGEAEEDVVVDVLGAVEVLGAAVVVDELLSCARAASEPSASMSITLIIIREFLFVRVDLVD
jgi:hypothetical protein